MVVMFCDNTAHSITVLRDNDMPFRNLLITLGALALLSLQVAAADSIPTREFVANSQVNNMKISPDGEHVALTYEEGTQVKLAVMNLADENIISSFEFGTNMHVLNFWWNSNTRLVMSVGEVTGVLDNMGRAQKLYAADRDGDRRREIFDSSVSGRFAMLHPLPEDDRRILIARYHGADRGVPRANRLDTYDGDMRPAAGLPTDNDIVALVADNDGEVRGAAAVSWGDALDERELRIHVRDDDGWRQLQVESRRPSPAISFLGFSADNQYIYFSSNHDMPENDRLGVFRYSFADDSISLLFRHEDMDIGGLLTDASRNVIGTFTRFGPMNYHLFEDEMERHMDSVRLLSGLVQAFPGNDVFLTSASDDGSKAIVRVMSDRNPGDFYLLDTETVEMRFLVTSLPNLPTDELVPMKPVTIKARDGLELHAYLTRPENGDESVPLVVNVHGGPFGIADNWGYHREAQLFAHHGYATLQVNFRGSGGRGEDFQRAGWKEWGGKMQDDVTDATRWAIEQGITDPDRICIYGGSYGGYATLMGVVKEPDLYQCGVGIVGVYDLVWFREGDGSDFSRQRAFGREGRQSFERFMSTSVGETAEELRPVSPVHHVDRIEAELFIIHGGSDVRVPVGHAERLRDALDEIGKSYEWMLKEEEGHGFYDVDNRVEMYDAVLEFLDRNIGSKAAGNN